MTVNTDAMEAAEADAEVGRFRNPGPVWRVIFLVFTAIGAFLSINQIFSLKLFFGIVILDNSYLYLLLGVFFAPVFLIFPATSRASRTHVPWYDVALFFAVVAITLYYASSAPRRSLSRTPGTGCAAWQRVGSTMRQSCRPISASPSGR